MFTYLYYFVRTPPGLLKLNPPELVPQSNDLASEFLPFLKPEAVALYGEKKFLFTIPEGYLEAWQKTGQLFSLFGMIVGMRWDERSIEQWKIKAAGLDLSSALVRETYPISPEAFGSDLDLSAEREREYHQAYLTLLNSVKPLGEYQGEFINPEVLLPFGINRSCLTLEKVID